MGEKRCAGLHERAEPFKPKAGVEKGTKARGNEVEKDMERRSAAGDVC